MPWLSLPVIASPSFTCLHPEGIGVGQTWLKCLLVIGVKCSPSKKDRRKIRLFEGEDKVERYMNYYPLT